MEFNEVYNEHKGLVYNTVRKVIKYKDELVDDVCQEVWMKIFRKLDQYDESKGVIGGWIYRIASNEAYKVYHLQNKSKEIYCLNNDDADNIEMYYNIFDYSDAFSNEKEKEQKQKIELIKRKSSKLKKSSKDVFQLYYFEGMIHEEIAEFKGLSVSTSKSQLMRAKARIKELIK